MASKGSFRELLENIREAHEAHRRVYKAARSKYGTNRKAHEATAKELEEFHRTLRLLDQTLAPLEKPFLAGDHSAVNEIISFLEADVAAFRSGYSKERYYRKLKSLKLSPSQIGRLQEIALKRCVSAEHRREDSELRRLMIHLADTEFKERIRGLPDSPNPHVQLKKALMLEVILRGRTDLVSAREGVARKRRTATTKQ